MDISNYIDALPTHHDENYLYTDAHEALIDVDTIVNASIDASGIGGSIVGTVQQMNPSSAFNSDIAQELVNLNTAAVEDILNVEFNEENPQPVTINLSSEGGKSVLAQSRIDINATERASGQLVINTNGIKSSANCVLKINIAPSAALDIVFLQTENNEAPVFINSDIDIQHDARITVSTVNITPGYVRNNLQVNFRGEHAEAKLYGIYKANAGHVDNTTLVKHLVPNCTSEELYKGVLDGNAVGAFSGRVVVAQDAQKTSSQQTNRNMLLSTDAHAYAKPQLEIYADDVKCSHGATSGQIDQQQLFYMQQRGIDAKTAKELLTDAFLLEVANNIPVEAVRNVLIAAE